MRTDESSDDCRLRRPERNRYFHGKLMTARDMQAEQRYHRALFTRLAQHVTGEGVVCGLDVDVERSDDDGIVVTIHPGYALDCCGRPIVVPDTATETIPPGEVPNQDRIALFVEYVECVREAVPIPGSENACEDDCAYNRVLEVFDVHCADGDDLGAAGKPVPSVEFPSKSQLSSDEPGSGLSSTDAGLGTIARSFTTNDDGEAIPCGSGEEHAIFLGVFVPGEGSTWVRDTDAPDRSRVYSNDMLYAAVARHTADFRNPHQVSLTASEAGDNAAALLVEDDESEDASVTVTSADGTIDVAASADAKRIDLAAGEALLSYVEDHFDELLDERLEERLDERLEEYLDEHLEAYLDEHLEAYLEDRLAPIEQYLLDKTLKFKHSAFQRVQIVYDSETAGEIVERTREAIDERIYTDAEAFRSFVEEVLEHERDVVDDVDGRVTGDSLERYQEALERLEETIENDERTVVQVAVAQDEVCEGAVFFERVEVAEEDTRPPEDEAEPIESVDPGDVVIQPEPVDPGDVTIQPEPIDPGDVVIQPEPIDPRDLELADVEPAAPEPDEEEGTSDTTIFRPTLDVDLDASADETTETTLPDLTGVTKEVGEAVLDRLELTPNVETVAVEDSRTIEGVAINEIVDQDPTPGEPIEPGQTVTLTVQDPPTVTDVDGIGSATEEKLASAGIQTVGELALADVGTIAEATGASESTAHDWQTQARSYAKAFELTKVPGVGVEEAEALADGANVTSLEDLRDADSELIKTTALAAADSGTVDEKTAETVSELDIDLVKENLSSLEL